MRTFSRARRRPLAPDRSPKRVYRAPARADPGMRAMLRAPPAVQRDVSATVAAGTASGGAPLPAAARTHFEPRLGYDFGGVRVHTGPEAAASARELNARAYTFGSDIVFAAGAYNPGTSSGRRLLAHELTHVMQRAQPVRVLRQPVLPQGTQSLHEDIAEEYRKAHGLPPRGIDPGTGEQVGPTDQELRSSGVLEAWVREKSGAIAAPEKAPKLAGAGKEDVRDGCRKETGNDEDWYHYCRRHREFVTNIYPQAIENIRSVSSPYSAAIAKLYASALPSTRLLAHATPKRGDFPLKSLPSFPGPLTFGATTHTFSQFTLLLDQSVSDVVAEQIDLASGTIAIRINELSIDVSLKNFPAIESAMVHEAMHAFSKVVEDKNRVGLAIGAIGGIPRAAVDLNLDLSSYGRFQGELEAAVLPFVRQIQQLPSLAGQTVSAQLDAEFTARKMIRETLARVEEAIYVKQRAGQGFTTADLGALPRFHTFGSYWEPRPPVPGELEDFLRRNQDPIDKKIGPIVVEIGAKYLSLRPRTSP